MGKLSFGAILTAGLLSLVLSTPAAARVSLSGIDQKLDTIITGIGEPTKIVLTGDLLDSADLLSGAEREFVIPADTRFFVREISCRASSFTAVLNARLFALSISALITNPNNSSTLRQTIAATEILGDDVVTLSSIQSAVFESNTYFDAGDRLVLDMFRRGGGSDGFINNFSCVLSGYMTDL